MNDTVAMPGQSRVDNPAARWNFGLVLAIVNVAIFFALSLILYALEVRDITYPTIIETIFAVGSVVCFVVLLRNGGELAIVAYFVLSVGFYFGLGTIYSTTMVAFQFNALFSTDDQWSLLNKINLLNSFSILIVLCVAWPLCKRSEQTAVSTVGIEQVVSLAAPLRRPMVLLAFPAVLILAFFSFPEPANPVWRTTFLLLQAISYSAILLCGMEWSRIPTLLKTSILGLMLIMSAIGLLTFSKAAALLPIVSLTAGLMLDARVRARLIVGAAVFMIVAFLALAILVNGSRANYATRPTNSLAERVTILSDTFTMATTAVTSSSQGGSDTLQLAFGVLNRFGDAGIQAFIIQRYDNGKPGDSLDNAWQVLVPRVLWPNKPDISRYGMELEGLMTNMRIPTWLAPTYTGEAYWNGGWPYVFIVSVMMGLEIGWFTLKWNRFRTEGLRHIGILIFAVPVMTVYMPVESWIVLTFIGEAAILAMLVLAADVVGPRLIRLISPKSSLTRVLSQTAT